ncbi:MAG: serine hydrolase domain-containing protein [Gemmatimonadota bacterium]
MSFEEMAVEDVVNAGERSDRKVPSARFNAARSRVTRTMCVVVTSLVVASCDYAAGSRDVSADGAADPAQLSHRFTPAKMGEIADSVRAFVDRGGVPAVVWGAFHAGEVVASGAYGHIDLEHRVPASTDAAFEIGSITKQFTAVAVVMLAIDGRLTLLDPIDQYLDYLPDRWAGVTIRHLLTHTSGIPDYESIMTYDGYRDVLTPLDVVAIADSEEPDFAPGEDYRYSNTGYFLLSEIVGRVSGVDFWTFLEQRIFEPLGMASTRPASPEEIIPGRARGYRSIDGQRFARDPIQPATTGGAGGLLSTLEDLAKWDQALRAATVLPGQWLDSMWTPGKLNDGSETTYGLGWDLRPYRGYRRVRHGGQTAGFTASLQHFLDDSVSVAFFFNQFGTSPGQIRDLVLHTAVPGSGYADLPVISEPPSPGAASVRSVLTLLEGRATGAAGADSLFLRWFDSPRRESMREEIRGWFGQLDRFEFLRAESLPSGTVNDFGNPVSEMRLYRMTAGSVVRYWLFWLDEGGRVTHFWLRRS